MYTSMQDTHAQFCLIAHRQFLPPFPSLALLSLLIYIFACSFTHQTSMVCVIYDTTRAEEFFSNFLGQYLGSISYCCVPGVCP